MKVKISVNQVPFSGYKNFDPYPHVSAENIANYDLVVCSIEQAIDMIETHSCTLIDCSDILNYVEHSLQKDLLLALFSKLRKNGELIIGGIDSLNVSRAYLIGQITLEEYNKIMYGDKNIWKNTRSASCPFEVEKELVSCGGKITYKKIDGPQFILKVKR